MKNTIKYILSFSAGALIGAVVMHLRIKDKYQSFADEEINAVRRMYSKYFEKKNDTKENDQEPNNEKEDTEEQDENVSKYVNYTKKYDGTKVEDVKIVTSSSLSKKPPYVISAYQFDEMEGYSIQELTYYADKVLADADGNVITDINGIVGPGGYSNLDKWLSRDDSVYIRDDNLKIDYEILLSEKSWVDTYALEAEN